MELTYDKQDFEDKSRMEIIKMDIFDSFLGKLNREEAEESTTKRRKVSHEDMAS